MKRAGSGEKLLEFIKKPPIVHVCPRVKGAKSRFMHLENFSLNFSSSSFAIRVNLLHPRLFLFLFRLFLSLWCFSTLTNYYF